MQFRCRNPTNSLSRSTGWGRPSHPNADACPLSRQLLRRGGQRRVFSRFYRERIRPDATLTYQGLSHQAGGAPVSDSAFQGDENAIVDFRYSQSPKLTWWFDHHASAFQNDGDEAHFLADRSGRKFHDARRKSCTVFLADIARERFGFDPGPMVELLEWAEIIDGAQFPSLQMAVGLREPALQLMTVLEANPTLSSSPRSSTSSRATPSPRWPRGR